MTKPIRNQMADDYSKLRNLNKRLDGLGAQEDEAIAAVKARYAEKRKRLRAERTELLTAVKGDDGPKPPHAVSGRGDELAVTSDAGSRLLQARDSEPPEVITDPGVALVEA